MPETKFKPTPNIITIPITVDVAELTQDVYLSFPQASFCLQCTGWKYGDHGDGSDFLFTFHDEEEDKEYTIDRKKAEKGVARLIELWAHGKCHFDGIDSIADMLDPCNWDAIVSDAAVQCSIFNEVIYG